jgi:hypothetical protein
MRRKIILKAILMILAIPIFLSACSNYGKLRLQPSSGTKVTTEDLVRNWKDYDVYYSGIATHRPSAVLFDPKGDSKTMTVHPWWVKVANERMLMEIMDWMTFDKHFDPVVWRVLGPNNDFYAYLYTAWNHALIRVVDENTLWINEMSLPRDYPGGEGRDGGASSGH